MSVAPAVGTQHKVMSGRKRIMVCGGAGFIGCHLCTRLVEMVGITWIFVDSKGHDVICVDNLLTGSKDNIRHLLGKVGVPGYSER